MKKELSKVSTKLLIVGVILLVLMIISIIIAIAVVVQHPTIAEIGKEEYYKSLNAGEVEAVLFLGNNKIKVLLKEDKKKERQFKKGSFASAVVVFESEDEFLDCKKETIKKLNEQRLDLKL